MIHSVKRKLEPLHVSKIVPLFGACLRRAKVKLLRFGRIRPALESQEWNEVFTGSKNSSQGFVGLERENA
jgi:hypothetical protein